MIQKTAFCNGNVVQRIARLTLVIQFIVCIFVALPTTGHAQPSSQTITFSGKNVPLDKIFKAIETQSGYTIFANKEFLKGLHPVTVSAKDMPVKDFLETVLKNQPIDYEINNKTIFIKEKIVAVSSAPVSEQAYLPKDNTPIEVTGPIRNASGAPLQGVTVSVKGTKSSTTTNADGEFTVKAQPGQTLVISYIGYQTLEEPIKGRNHIDITLKEAINEMTQVVVTALGITKKTRSLSYNVQEVSGSEVNNVKDANFVNSLTGKVAGATINSSSSGIGGSVRVIMRGAKSLFGNNNALYVVDGVQLPDLTTNQASDVFSGAGATGDGISNINPDDIASISVLTGPAAAALYGSQAANGVIMITTKKGQSGKLNISLSNNTSFFSPFVLPKFQNEYGSDQGSFYSWGTKLKTPTNYNPSDFFQTGLNETNALSLSTGTDKNQTYLSASAVDAKGIIPNNKLTRYNFSVRNTSSFLDDKFHLDLSMMYINGLEQNMISQGQYFNPIVPIYLFPRGDDIEKYQVYERYDASRNFKTQFWPYGDEGFQMQNPYWIINRDFFNNNKERYVLSAGAKYQITDWLNITGRAKLDDNSTVGEKKYDASTSGLFASPAGAYYNNTATTKQIYADVIANVNKSFGDIDLTLNVGSSILDTKYALTGYGGNLLSVPNLFSFGNINTVTAAATQDGYHDQAQSVFASAQLGYKNMIFLDGTARNDWSSALINTTANSIFYPSVGLSAVLTDLFKLRSTCFLLPRFEGSYSEVGNPPQRFITLASYPIIGGYPVTSSYLPATGLQPERTKSTEAGINLKFLKNKINLDVTLYNSSTYNQLFNPTLAPSTGYSSFYVNAGEVNNKGIEAALGFNGKIGRLNGIRPPHLR